MSTLSTVVIVGGLLAVFYFARGGKEVRHFYFDRHDMWQAFVGDHGKGLSSVGEGLLTNIWVFLVSEVFILFFGSWQIIRG